MPTQALFRLTVCLLLFVGAGCGYRELADSSFAKHGSRPLQIVSSGPAAWAAARSAVDDGDFRFIAVSSRQGEILLGVDDDFRPFAERHRVVVEPSKVLGIDGDLDNLLAYTRAYNASLRFWLENRGWFLEREKSTRLIPEPWASPSQSEFQLP